MYSSINDYVRKRIHISDDELSYFNELLNLQCYKKKEFLLQPGEICRFEGYIIKGCVRTYYIHEQGLDVDLSFAIEDWWIGDIASFSQQTPSQLYIQALEDTQVLTIHFESKENLFKKIPAFERLFRLMIQKTHETMMHRFIAHISEPAETRYLHFLKKYPKIPARVPQHLIAAYLGISPEFLSKIKARMLKK